MRPLWRTTLGLAAASAAMVTALGATGGPAGATAPPVNELGFANLALTQMLTRDADSGAVTRFGDQTLPQVWDQLYQVQLPTQDGMSSPYLLRSHDTGRCLQDLGEGQPVTAVVCETDPVEGSAQLWQIHRVADRTINGRNYYYQINRATGRVLTAQLGPEGQPVVSAPAVPVSKSGAANAQLWVQLAAA